MPLVEVVDQLQHRVVERALIGERRLDVPAHEAAQEELDRRRAFPTTGRSAEIAHSRSAWSRTESRTCAGVTSAAAGPPARTSSLRRSKSAATSVCSSRHGGV